VSVSFALSSTGLQIIRSYVCMFATALTVSDAGSFWGGCCSLAAELKAFEVSLRVQEHRNRSAQVPVVRNEARGQQSALFYVETEHGELQEGEPCVLEISSSATPNPIVVEPLSVHNTKKENGDRYKSRYTGSNSPIKSRSPA
jgi:hypothetical protein